MSNPALGWSYPAGCSGPPEGPEPSALQEELWALLENAEVTQYLIELVDQVVGELESDATADCPVSMAEQLKQEARLERSMRQQEEAWWRQLETGQ